MNNLSKIAVATTHLQDRKTKIKPTNTQASFGQVASSSSLLAKNGGMPASILQAIIQLILQLIMQLQENTNTQKDNDNTDSEQGREQPQQDDKGGKSGKGDIDPHHIKGTSGNDCLTATQQDDVIRGLAGNDRLSGRGGDDKLFGNSGNDRINGGRGNDQLEGGAGRDRLYGGKGDDTLLGGAGNDKLISRFGSDKLEGGSGNDTARIRGNLEDYSITSDALPLGSTSGDIGSLDGITFTLTNESTGHQVTATDIESYQFNDQQLSGFELLKITQSANPSTPTTQNDSLLALSTIQKDRVLELFGVQPGPDAGIRVIDKDASGTISIGDEAVLASGGPSSVSQQFRTLSAEDVESINNPTEPEQPAVKEPPLNGTKWQLQFIGSQPPYNDQRSSLSFDEGNIAYSDGVNQHGGQFESDQSGDFKVGNIFGTLIGAGPAQSENATSINEGLASAVRYDISDDGKELTFFDKNDEVTLVYSKEASDTDSKTLDLSKEQSAAIGKHFNDTSPLAFDGLATEFTGKVLDTNGDNQLGVGDQVELRKYGGNAIPQTDFIELHTLTQDDLVSINSGGDDAGDGDRGNVLQLSDQQQAAINTRFNHTPGPDVRDGLATRFTGTAVDNNGDGKLSAGDVIKLRDTGGIAGIDQIRDHALTVEDIDAINTDSNTDSGVVKGGGVSVGGSLNNDETISNDRIVDINGQNYTVGFLKQQVEDYANSSFPPTGIVDAGFGIFKWGTSNSFAAGNAFEKYITTSFPQGEPGLREPEALALTQQQQDAIGARFNHKPAPNLADAPTIEYTGTTLDKDGDGKLSVGDSVKLRSFGGFGLPGTDNAIHERTLSKEDIAFIESDRSNPLLDISRGLSNTQRERLNDAIKLDDNASIERVFDGNSDGKLSVGDILILQRSFEAGDGGNVNLPFGVATDFHTLTQDDLDRYLQGNDTTTSQAKLDFESNKQKWQNARPQNYSFTLSRSGFLTEEARRPVDLTVSGNTVTNATFADGTTGDVPDFNQLSIDDLFGNIEKALDNNAAEVRVTYNAETGIPESIFIDQDRRLADEEVSLTISNFNL